MRQQLTQKSNQGQSFYLKGAELTDSINNSAVRTLSDLPSPRGLPLLGNALQLDLPRMHLILEQWAEEFGSVFTIGLGPKRIFVCSDPDLLQTALRERPDRYRRFSAIESVIKEMKANGVFSVEGEAWRPQRRLVKQALASRHFSSFFPVLRDITERLRKKWEHSAKAGQVVDMTQDLVRFTVDATTALAFGEDPNTIEESGNVIQEHLAAIFPMIMKRINAPMPLWRYVKLPSDRKFQRSLRAVHHHVESLIERSKKRMREQPSDNPRNLLEAMLDTANLPDSGITDEVIAANVMTLLLAGEDTTAHSLSWAMYFISQDKGLQSKLHAASTDAFGSSPLCPTFEDVKKLDLFEFVTQETSRFKPVVPLTYLEPIVDVVLGNVSLPSGTPLFFMLRLPCWTASTLVELTNFCRNVGPAGTWMCNPMTRRLMPNLEPVRVFAQVAISQGSRCVLYCRCFLAIFPWSWQPALDPSRKLLPSP